MLEEMGGQSPTRIVAWRREDPPGTADPPSSPDLATDCPCSPPPPREMDMMMRVPTRSPSPPATREKKRIRLGAQRGVELRRGDSDHRSPQGLLHALRTLLREPEELGSAAEPSPSSAGELRAAFVKAVRSLQPLAGAAVELDPRRCDTYRYAPWAYVSAATIEALAAYPTGLTTAMLVAEV